MGELTTLEHLIVEARRCTDWPQKKRIALVLAETGTPEGYKELISMIEGGVKYTSRSLWSLFLKKEDVRYGGNDTINAIEALGNVRTSQIRKTVAYLKDLLVETMSDPYAGTPSGQGKSRIVPAMADIVFHNAQGELRRMLNYYVPVGTWEGEDPGEFTQEEIERARAWAKKINPTYQIILNTITLLEERHDRETFSAK